MKRFVVILSSFIYLSCNTSQVTEKSSKDPLPSWNEGNSKQSILAFVEQVTNEQTADFVPVAERIAVFDNDGTLWSEQPMYFQFMFAVDRLKTMAADNPALDSNEAFKAVLDNDMEKFASFGMKAIVELVMTTHAGMTTEEFEKIVLEWMATARHPRFNKPYNEVIYQPMLELMDYLRSNDFKVYIVSGGGIDFMRPWTEDAYRIPKEQVVGSSVKTVFEMRDGLPVLVRLPELDFIDDKEGKPVGIHKFIGRRPIFCAGNSDGDLQMMQYTAAGAGKRLMLYIHHTDADREWAYDRESHVGTFDKALDEAQAKGWTLVSMKDDWNKIYPFE